MGVAVDIINQISEYNTSILRDHILKQSDAEEVSHSSLLVYLQLFTM